MNEKNITTIKTYIEAIKEAFSANDNYNYFKEFIKLNNTLFDLQNFDEFTRYEKIIYFLENEDFFNSFLDDKYQFDKFINKKNYGELYKELLIKAYQKQNTIKELITKEISFCEEAFSFYKKFKQELNYKNINSNIEKFLFIMNEERTKTYYAKLQTALNEIDNLKIGYKKLIEKSNPFNNNKFYYRGHSKLKFELLPSIMRKNGLMKEDFYFHQMNINCAESFDGLNHIGQLVKMQHYDCPTRLLDITENPLVALYFACTSKEKNNDDGIVYIFAVPEEEILYYDSDKALMLSCLAPLKYDYKENIYKSCINKIIKDEFVTNKDVEFNKFVSEIRKDNSSFEINANPIHLLDSYFFQPLKNNNRIIKQSGAFIINGLSLNPIINRLNIENKVKFKIKIKNKENILRELDMIGINESTLFPEVDKVADYLKNI